ncbi:amino acid ABC transporter substrate-binding protein, PAAT family [Lentzea waywayandensis]|uniref:Amino acid ABC transporter substrate-binding protein, PAAT family n=2 Tax=Lentzea waywayandensis TaxID=84724 RepID=A0A1I6FJV0_9PSEU|nr:amino acid ABC transporter substrate-binding protein, PAAT family [Lentzea waywayandensis]
MLIASTLALFVTLTSSGCSHSENHYLGLLGRSTTGRLNIGITFDQPGLGQRLADDTVRGFDVDVAKYIANELNVPEQSITWKQVLLANREGAIERGEVDFVAAAYSITPSRQQRVAFAGPYYIAGQDLLVRQDEKSINGPGDLASRRLCSVTGTTSSELLRRQYASTVRLVEFPRFDLCVTALLNSQVDAVTTDDLILAGYSAKNPELLRLVGQKFSVERYGIGLRKDDADGRRRVNEAIQKMIASGAWKAALSKNFPDPDFTPSPPPLAGRN